MWASAIYNNKSPEKVLQRISVVNFSIHFCRKGISVPEIFSCVMYNGMQAEHCERTSWRYTCSYKCCSGFLIKQNMEAIKWKWNKEDITT